MSPAPQPAPLPPGAASAGPPAPTGSPVAWTWPALLVVLAGAVPLLVTSPAPLQDWPSHLARVWITGQVLHGDPFWSARYGFQGFLIPNAILDIGVLALTRIGLGLDAAGIGFLLALYALFVTGFRALSARVAGPSALAVPLAVACFYNMALCYGLVNYLAGVALLLWALVAWEGTPRWPRRALLALPCAAAIALCHLLAAFMFVGIAGLLDLATLARTRRPAELLPSCTALLAACGALLLSPVGGDDLGAVEHGHTALPRLLLGKAATFARAMATGQIGPDLVLALVALVLAAAILATRPQVRPRWLVITAALVLVTLAAPFKIGEGTFIDARLAVLPIIVACLCLAPTRRAAWATPLVTALVLARIALLAHDWHQDGRFDRSLETALAALPPGSTLLAARDDSPAPGPAQSGLAQSGLAQSGLAQSGLAQSGLAQLGPARLGPPPALAAAFGWFGQWAPPMTNVVTLAVRHGVFVPATFASKVQQPLFLRPDWKAPWPQAIEAPTPERLDDALAQARASCRPDIPTSLLVLYAHPRPDLAPPDDTLPPFLRSRFRIIGVC